MIEAKKSKWFSSLFHVYNKQLLQKSFSNIYISTSDIERNKPTLFIANHSSWWDGLICFHLSQTIIPYDCFAMMSEEGLQSYPFFKKLGGYSISLTSHKELRSSLDYTNKLLQQKKAVWIFPQGEEQHLEKRPLTFQKGAAFIAKQLPELQVVPVTFYYSFGHEPKPNLFITIGSAIDNWRKDNVRQVTAFFEEKVTGQLEVQRHSVIHEQTTDYSVLLNGFTSFAKHKARRRTSS
ncbi:lysophospholipid acyltransferase family protein [Bacillus alkalicellulosilyticus]|uniref:lysophospholipid acyltransferase family protein n=1 Tax=Alkalihalobacterium alkalicellulosilyticum TaxID=1912214 RepID=UPI0009964F81|nr:lysophospholipid acyltransferase family protein [Bacillus alkalicellulosilyticus]